MSTTHAALRRRLASQLARNALALVRPAPPAPVAEPPRPDETADEAAYVGAFIGRVNVVPVTGSRLVDVHFTGLDPKFTAEAANVLVDEYVAQNLEVKLQSSQNMLDWLQKELGAQQAKVEESERALAEYRDRENAMSLDDKNNIVLSRLNALNDALMEFQRMPFLAAVKEAKMRSFVTPGETLNVEAAVIHEGSGYTMTEAKIKTGGKLACNATLTFRHVPFPQPELRAHMQRVAADIGFPEQLIHG